MTTTLFGVEKMAKFLNLSPSTVYELVARKKIPAYRIGNSIRFSEELAKDCLEKSRGEKR